MLTKLLIPDLAFAAALLTFGFGLTLFDGPRKLFRDSDSGWHIRNGESILVSHLLPYTDPYSFSQPGQPWVAWEWGADVVMGAAHRQDGLAGVALLYLSAIALCTWLWFRLHWAVGGGFLTACVMASPMLSTANLHWLARPHVFGWVMLLVSLGRLERLGASAPLWRTALAFALLGAAWANLHASFFLLPLLAAVYAVSVWVRAWLWDDRGDVPASVYWIASAAGLAGSLANPYGISLHRHVIEYLANGELLERIGEFQTFNFHSEGAFQILLTLALGAVGAVLAFLQRNVAHAVILLVFSAAALRSARMLPVLALLLPLANGAVTRALVSAQHVRPALRTALRGFVTYSANLRRLETGFRGYAWSPLVVFAGYLILHSPAMAARTGFDPAEFPVAAAERIAQLPANARILSPDKFGGYLIYRFAGQRKVFFDGRSDIYGVAFLRDYIELVQVRPGWEAQLKRHAFTHALLPRAYSLSAVLPLTGWRETYRDQTAVILESPESARTAQQ